jgi:hypothetical protein
MHKIFVITILIGCTIAIWHFIVGVIQWDNAAYNIPENVYISWIGGTIFFSQSYWFYLVFPLLVSLSIGIEYGYLYRKRYFYQIEVRKGRKKYTTEQGVKIFLMGALVALAPLTLNFLLTMTQRPLIYPDPLVSIGPYANEVGAYFYYMHPMIYTIVFILFDGMFAGAVALFTCSLCNVLENYFIAAILPFAIYYTLSTISGMFDSDFLSINLVLLPGYGVKSLDGYILVFIFVIISVALWFALGMKKDL